VRVQLLLRDADLAGLEDALAMRGHRVARATAEDDDESFAAADLIIADVELADRLELVAKVSAASPGIEFVLVGPSRGSHPADVVACLERPFELDRMLAAVDDVADILDGERLREPVDLVDFETLFAGDSPQIRGLLRRVRLVARSEAAVWIVGHDGSGRAIIARAIHDRSIRRGQPFVAFNAMSYSDDELCRLLFQGDTPAIRTAGGGTLFVEQVTKAGPATQRELAQFLERRREPGAQTPRLIVGVESEDISAQRPYIADLYFRLKVLELEIPLLKDRARDLEEIVGRMLARLSAGDPVPAVSEQTIRLLERYTFPGNLLELAHALMHAFVLARGDAIEPEHLPASIRKSLPGDVVEREGAADLESLDIVAKRFERDYLLRVLRSVGGNRGRAAEILGLSRKGLWGKLKAHGISDDDIEQGDDELVRPNGSG
jgi:two-component system, NtrC family, response regulator AtoC